MYNKQDLKHAMNKQVKVLWVIFILWVGQHCFI